MVILKNPANFPKVDTITPSLYVIGIDNPDTDPTDVLILTQALSGGGDGAGNIIVDSNDVVYPNQARLKFDNPVFVISDDDFNSQTLVDLDLSGYLSKPVYDADNDGIIDRVAGGTGVNTTGFEGFLYFTPTDSIAVRSNFSANRVPNNNDDLTQGYVVGSRWIFGSEEWVATSVNAGSAVWISTTFSSVSTRHTIQAGGVSLPDRGNLNFIGAGFIAIFDDAANNATVVQMEVGDMIQSVYDPDKDGIIGLEQGGLGIDATTGYPGLFFSGGSPDSGSILRVNLVATTSPTVNNDITNNYAIGSVWQNTSASLTTNNVFINKDNTAGVAVWTPLGATVSFIDTSDIVQPTRTKVKVTSSDNSLNINYSDSPTLDRTSIDLTVNPINEVDWVERTPDLQFNVRDTDYGKTFLLSGTHDVLLPSSTTATIRDGFQCTMILATTGGTITFIPEDVNSAVNAKNNTLSEQWSAVWVSFRASTNSWYIIGGVDIV